MYSHIVAFGDSLSDNGSNTSYIPGVGAVFGNDRYGFGIASNGDVWVENLALTMGASLDDRAYCGATTADLPVGLKWQAIQYLADLSDASFASAVTPVSDNTLYTLWVGGEMILVQGFRLFKLL